MINVEGIYENGKIRLFEKIKSKKPVRIIVTFPDYVQTEEEKGLQFDDFSFGETRKALKNVKTSFSDEVVKERRAER